MIIHLSIQLLHVLCKPFNEPFVMFLVWGFLRLRLNYSQGLTKPDDINAGICIY